MMSARPLSARSRSLAIGLRAVGAMALAMTAGLVQPPWRRSNDGRRRATPPGQADPSIAAAAPAELRSFYSQQVDWKPCEDELPVRQGQGPAGLRQARRRHDRTRRPQAPSTGGKKKGSLLVNPGGPGGSGYDFVKDAGATHFSDKVRSRTTTSWASTPAA